MESHAGCRKESEREEREKDEPRSFLRSYCPAMKPDGDVIREAAKLRERENPRGS